MGDDLFGSREPEPAPSRPLADRMRPSDSALLFGQPHLLGEGKPLARMLATGRLQSMVLWGPPGCGKTTLGRLLAHTAKARFIALSAVFSGVKDIRNAVDQARQHRRLEGSDTVVFVDEAHRFNKSQQDGFLPFVEDGTLIFIGATTENPSFELNSALLSRLRVYVLKSLDGEALEEILNRAVMLLAAERPGTPWQAGSTARKILLMAADGDGRRLLNLLELAFDLAESASGAVTDEVLDQALAGSARRRFDKGGDEFYDQISALHKAIRGSAPDGALYWFACMLEGGCDPRYLARRLVRIASEDIGNADPRALQLALNAWQTQERLGSPEGELALGQAVVYLACAAKSNAVYRAFNEAMSDARQGGSHEVPLHLRNAPTALGRALGHGRDYRYAHDEAHGYAAGERYFPDAMQEKQYYHPVDRGLEQRIRLHLEELQAQDRRQRKDRRQGR